MSAFVVRGDTVDVGWGNSCVFSLGILHCGEDKSDASADRGDLGAPSRYDELDDKALGHGRGWGCDFIAKVWEMGIAA